MRRCGRNRKGEAVMAVVMAVMIVGGLVLWLSTGRHHMMPMGGGHMERTEKAAGAAENVHGARGNVEDGPMAGDAGAVKRRGEERGDAAPAPDEEPGRGADVDDP